MVGHLEQRPYLASSFEKLGLSACVIFGWTQGSY